MRKTILLIILFVCSLYGYTQIDTRPVVGVSRFNCDQSTPYSGLVTEKVIEMLTNTKRFQVVDRTSYDKVNDELEFQKSEAFIDSDRTAKQGVTVAAEKIITGNINKIPIYRIKNPDGSVKGFKASIDFQMKVVDIETGLSSEAKSFQGQTSRLMFSPESAITESMNSLKDALYEYFRQNFPLTAEIVKIHKSKKDFATEVLINIGKGQGVNIDDKFIVSHIEILNGKPLPTIVGEIKVIELAGEDFSVCKVSKKQGSEILSRFQAGEKLKCDLIVK